MDIIKKGERKSKAKGNEKESEKESLRVFPLQRTEI